MEFSNCYGCRVKNLASTTTASLPWHYFNPSQITLRKQDPSVCPPGKYACSAKSLARFAPIEVIRIFFFFCLKSPESWTLGSVIPLKESGIPPTFGIRNPQQGILCARLSWINLHGATCLFLFKYF